MLITKPYIKQNKELHKNATYGRRGYLHIENVLMFCKLMDAETVLDYGCGKGTFKEQIEEKVVGLEIRNYDPAVEAYSFNPEPADVVVCTDVLEHIEPECLEDVLRHIRELTKKIAYIVVSIKPDYTKLLPDGRNPHLIVNKPSWWLYKLRTVFFEGVIKVSETEKDVTIIVK